MKRLEAKISKRIRISGNSIGNTIDKITFVGNFFGNVKDSIPVCRGRGTVFFQDCKMAVTAVVTLYADALNEASGQPLRKVLHSQLGTASEAQFQVFNLMFERRYYPLKPADESAVRETVAQMKQIKSQLN